MVGDGWSAAIVDEWDWGDGVRGDSGESGKVAGHRRNGADGGWMDRDCTEVFSRGFLDGLGWLSCLQMSVLSSICNGILKSDVIGLEDNRRET